MAQLPSHYRDEGGLDFADALHFASMAAGARFSSFDQALARRAAQLAGAPPVDLL